MRNNYIYQSDYQLTTGYAAEQADAGMDDVPNFKPVVSQQPTFAEYQAKRNKAREVKAQQARERRAALAKNKPQNQPTAKPTRTYKENQQWQAEVHRKYREAEAKVAPVREALKALSAAQKRQADVLVQLSKQNEISEQGQKIITERGKAIWNAVREVKAATEQARAKGVTDAELATVVKQHHEREASPGACMKCGHSTMQEGDAMVSTFTGEPDDIGGRIVTLSFGGPGRLVKCWKCSRCGHSVTK